MVLLSCKFKRMQIDGVDAMRLGDGFLLASPGVTVVLRERTGDSWVAVGYETGKEERWIGSGGGSFEEALSRTCGHAVAVGVDTREKQEPARIPPRGFVLGTGVGCWPGGCSVRWQSTGARPASNHPESEPG